MGKSINDFDKTLITIHDAQKSFKDEINHLIEKYAEAIVEWEDKEIFYIDNSDLLYIQCKTKRKVYQQFISDLRILLNV